MREAQRRQEAQRERLRDLQMREEMLSAREAEIAHSLRHVQSHRHHHHHAPKPRRVVERHHYQVMCDCSDEECGGCDAPAAPVRGAPRRAGAGPAPRRAGRTPPSGSYVARDRRPGAASTRRTSMGAPPGFAKGSFADSFADPYAASYLGSSVLAPEMTPWAGSLPPTVTLSVDPVRVM
eukprot:NODE_5998_length_661_cov_33.174837_g5083_i0.p1 GENE.NODE_5998_length_661_cov_33.174837_g5083_i0~~NODE_5998_length_661_cov_33.174837_g5083_i0.p1  ORF type:complete len:194 (+),score=26.60 NODE_5998_length_661_cov_33.174837_g5083_i0:47-583(+)